MNADLWREEMAALQRRRRMIERLIPAVVRAIRSDREAGRISADDERLLADLAMTGAMPSEVVDDLLRSAGVPECGGSYGASALAVARWTNAEIEKQLREREQEVAAL